MPDGSTNAPADRYVTRGLGQYCDGKAADVNPWPTCETHFSLITDNPTWYGWVCESAHAPHGNVHLWIGGILNCDEAIRNLSDLVGKENAGLLMGGATDRHAFWRAGMYRCEGVADEDMPLEKVRVPACARVACSLEGTALAG